MALVHHALFKLPVHADVERRPEVLHVIWCILAQMQAVKRRKFYARSRVKLFVRVGDINAGGSVALLPLWLLLQVGRERSVLECRRKGLA